MSVLENGIPGWLEDLRLKFGSGVANVFLLHGAVNDYVVQGMGLRQYICQVMATRDVAVYNRAEGITFPLATSRQRFIEALGLSQEPDPVLAALGTPGGGGEVQLPIAPSVALPLLEQWLKLQPGEDSRGTAAIIEYAESICPQADLGMMSADDRTVLVTLARWGQGLLGQDSVAILVAQNLTDVHQDLRAASSKIEAIEVKPPSFDERWEYIDLLAQAKGIDGFDLDWAASATAGLSRIHIEDILLRAAEEGGLTQELVKERKDAIIASEFGEVIEIMDPRLGFEAIGGLQHVKDFFERSVIQPMREGRRNRCPQGVLMTGPAGTGKTIMAEAVARESGINCVILNLARIFGQYVGMSERNLEKALRCIESLSPTIVFIDEIDQSVSRGQGAGDSGVSNRVFKRLLEFMSDGAHRGRIVFLAATNRPDLMDAALRRPGRFDKKIAFLIPDEDERAAIFRAMVRRYVGHEEEGLIPTAVFEQIVRATEGWTGAEIEAAVVKAVELMEDENLSLAVALVSATERLSPSTSDIEYMTWLAIKETNDRDLLPPKYRRMLDDRQTLDEKLEATRPRERGRRSLSSAGGRQCP